MCKAFSKIEKIEPDDQSEKASFVEKGIRFTRVDGAWNCENCGKKLKTRFTAKIHVFSHTKEKPFSCQTCGQTFSHRSTLVNHRKIHNEPEFQCPNCLAWFARKANLKRHLRVVHKASEDDINRCMPKAKPGPRRKTPRRDLNFAPLYGDDAGVAYRGKLVPPISFDDNPSIPVALSSQSEYNRFRSDPTLRRDTIPLPPQNRERISRPAINPNPLLPAHWFDLSNTESEYRLSPPRFVALPPSISSPPQQQHWEDPFGSRPIFPIERDSGDSKESLQDSDKVKDDFDSLFLPWTE